MDRSVSDIFQVLGTEMPVLNDLRNLAVPEPMEKVLLACAQLGADEFFLAHLPHVPTPLLPILETRGLCWWVHEKADESALLLVCRKT